MEGPDHISPEKAPGSDRHTRRDLHVRLFDGFAEFLLDRGALLGAVGARD